ncbi:unnamed protein product [Medioppia subpectinata]|uniref:Uncharacterized protein n=1 Tax=Medioppia subpectinata TaxID=1979941 RepID=A0A7R9L1F9_9ACAR|nr:unnamed protein product [Medioppia subpectinata]CAG2113454.1 unnamed protein product [Medioppia subpectinata]
MQAMPAPPPYDRNGMYQEMVPQPYPGNQQVQVNPGWPVQYQPQPVYMQQPPPGQPMYGQQPYGMPYGAPPVQQQPIIIEEVRGKRNDNSGGGMSKESCCCLALLAGCCLGCCCAD